MFGKFLPYFSRYIKLLKKHASDCQSILDLGCGSASPIKYIKVPYSIGVDIFFSYLKQSKSKRIHTDYIYADLTNVNFKEKSVDAVFLLHVVEHLNKVDAIKLIKKSETWGRKKVIIVAPNGYIPQDEYDCNPYQKHLSGWSVEEFESLGYRVYGVGGLKIFREINISKIIKSILYLFTEPFCILYPKLSNNIFAIKVLDHDTD